MITARIYIDARDRRGRWHNLFCNLTLPFVPMQGMRLKVLPSDEHHPVHEVYWSAAEGLTVFLCEQRGRCGGNEKLRALGWSPYRGKDGQ